MADVARDRGQLLLVTALGIAMLFVTLALVVNTVIYTENLATRSSKVAGGSDAVTYEEAAREATTGLLDYANHHNHSSRETLADNVSTGVDDWSTATEKLYAQSGIGTNASLVSTTNGTRIEQGDASRTFENESGTLADWTLAASVDRTRAFRINVTDASDLETAGSGRAFAVNVTDGSTFWRLNVTNDGSDTTVGVRNGSGGETTCVATDDEPTIDVTAGTVAGDDCPGLSFAEGVTGAYEIAYENGDNVSGTYALFVSNASLADSPAPHFESPGAGSPFVAHAVYAATVEVTYQTPQLYFNTSLRIAPGEP